MQSTQHIVFPSRFHHAFTPQHCTLRVSITLSHLNIAHFTSPSHFHSSEFHVARLHLTVTTQKCMLHVSSCFHIVELHALHFIAFPQRRIARCASHRTSTLQVCMLCFLLCYQEGRGKRATSSKTKRCKRVAAS